MVDGVPVDSYLTKFVWDEAKYPTMSPLKEIVDGIRAQVAKIDDDLKVRIAEYNNVRSQLNAINRKQTGSQRTLSVQNTWLRSLQWLSCYETLTTYVVPSSSKNLHEDNEYALYTVTLFNRDADNFRIKARERGFQICDFEYNSEAQESRKQELEKLMQDQESLKSSLLQWCYTSYGEVFTSWMHFCAVRLFAESILRYGLPPSFLKKVRTILEGLCGNSNSTFWKTEDEGSMASLGGEADAHPYVSFTINLI
ncbi:putative ATPase, V1 complex, subunit C, vacuolar ATP synthase subunit C superfamily [Helianthus annuus]|nr:putative ATPase, V1 complex, subunit C, vacuolar ATP synthase subunit C superfamily [Helianthus annuus]